MEKNVTNSIKAKLVNYSYALVACFFSATMWVFVRELIPMISVSNQIFWRLILSSLLLGFIFRKHIRPSSLTTISKRDVIVLIARGASLYVGGTTLASYAIQETSYGITVLILSLPLASLLAVYMVNEKLSKKDIFALFISIIGVSFVIIGRFNINMVLGYGAIKAVAATLLMAVGIVGRRYQTNSLNEVELTTLLLFFSSILYLIKMAIFKDVFVFPNSWRELLLIIMSSVWTAGFIFFVAKAIMKLEVVKVNIIFGLQPIIATFVGVFLYMEQVSVDLLVGGICVISSITILNTKFNMQKRMKNAIAKL